MADPKTEEKLSRIRRVRRRVETARGEIETRASAIESQVPAAQSAVRAYHHDRAVGGEIMAGAIAFRFFVFLLPLVLVLVSLLGIAANADTKGADHVAKRAGIGGIAAKSVSDSARLSEGGRWIALVLGLIALYSTSVALVRAVRIAHALAWGTTATPMRKKWKSALFLLGVTVAALVLVSAISQFRENHRLIGLVMLLGSVLAYAAGWLGISLLLPHRDAEWIELVPGAVLVGVGLEVLHFVTVYYISRKVSSASQLYGPIGAAVAILLWAYLIGRLVVGAAVLNASMYNHRHEVASDAGLKTNSA
jgi:uncharacterized BrkB/YihY/UPF0761 family membrane protein